MSLIKKLGNYKSKNYLDDILYDNEIKINNLLLNNDVLTSIKNIENLIKN